MIEPPPEDMTRNPCGEIDMGESSMPSTLGIARKLLAVDELPSGALIAYESEILKKPLADEGKPL
jgi:hypothetical protein